MNVIYNMSKEDLIFNGIKNFEIVNETNSPKILIENFESILWDISVQKFNKKNKTNIQYFSDQ